jgi:glycosyltransferase involved in cell wall biosynthesis
MLQALARNLYGKAVLIAVDPPVSLPDRHLVRDWRKCARAVSRPVVQWSDNLWLVRPWAGSLSRPEVAYQRALRQVSTRAGVSGRNVAAMVFRPQQARLLGIANEQHVVYECYDEYRLESGAGISEDVVAAERRLLQHCDLVLTTSLPLYAVRTQEHPNVHYTPNGVDYERFASLDSGPVPDDMARIPHPTVGFVGNFFSWLDLPMIGALVDTLEDHSFVFVGPVSAREAAQALARRPNVWFLGVKPRSALAAYLRAMDVTTCLLVRNDFTDAVLPLKVPEYLAAGKPVIATPVAALRDFAPVVRFVQTAAEAGLSVRELARTDNPSRAAERRAFARAYDWDVLTKHTAKLILETCQAS